MSLLSKNGGERIWQYRNVLHEVPGMPARVLGHAQDVTESVRAVQALKESERRFRLLADTTPVLIWMSDPSGSCTFVNQPWLDFTGRPEAEHLGAGWTDSIHPEDRPRVIEAFGTAVTSRAAVPRGVPPAPGRRRVPLDDGVWSSPDRGGWLLCGAGRLVRRRHRRAARARGARDGASPPDRVARRARRRSRPRVQQPAHRDRRTDPAPARPALGG